MRPPLDNPSIRRFSAPLIATCASFALAVALSKNYRIEQWLLLSLCFALFFGVSLALLHKEIRILSLTRVTISGWLFITYAGMILFPSIRVFGNHPGIFKYFFMAAVQLATLAFALGVTSANKVLKSNADETEHFYRQDTTAVEAPYLRLGVDFLLMVSLVLLALYLLQVKTIPLFHLLSGKSSAASLALMRENSFKLLNTRLIYLFVWAKGTIFPLLILISLGGYLSSRDRWWLSRLLLSAPPGLFFLTLSIEKKPAASLFAMIFFLVYLLKKGRLSMTGIGVILALGLFFPVLVFQLIEPTTFVGLFFRIYSRITHMPADILYYYFEIFPSKVDFLMGRSISHLGFLFGGNSFNLENYVFRYINAGAGLKSGYANAAFIGDLWANFGAVGVVFGTFLVGFFFQAIHIFLIRQRKTVVNLSVYSFCLYVVWTLTSLSFFVSLYTGGLLIALLIRQALESQRKYFSDAPSEEKQITPVRD